MEESNWCSETDPSKLLNQLEYILESDPLIDEVGFIHPSQFLALSKETGTLVPPSLETLVQTDDEHANTNLSASNPSDMVFWIRDHKLGISSKSLLTLYNAAKNAFMAAVDRYKDIKLSVCHDESEEENIPGFLSSFQNCSIEVMKHSRALLLLSSDFGTAWNYRKLIILQESPAATYMDELHFTKLVLSYSPKSERTWSHRRWVIKMIAEKCLNLQEIVEKESHMVKKIAEKSKMNYRAWNHRCWLVSYMSSRQVMYELISSRDWAGLSVADNSCFHYRTEDIFAQPRLILRMLEDSQTKQGSKAISTHNAEYYKICMDELDWNEMLIKRYIGREALWLYRRFLSSYWINLVAGDTEIKTFLDNELQLFGSCQEFSVDDFEDYRAQAMFAATYMLWIARHCSRFPGIELEMKLRSVDLLQVLNKYCPERSSLWNCLYTP